MPVLLPVEEEKIQNISEAATENTTSAIANVPPDLVVNGIEPIISSPSPVKKKRLYQRRPSSKPENEQLASQAVVQLSKLSPDSISLHTNGEVSAPPKKRTVNGPMFRNKHIIKKKVLKPKAAVRKTEVKEPKAEVPSTFTEESDFVECVRCAAVVEVANVRQHLTVCAVPVTAEEMDLSKDFRTRKDSNSFYHVLPLTISGTNIPESPSTPSKASGSRGYGTRSSSIRTVQSTYGPDACGLCGARGLSDGLARYLHSHIHHQRYSCLFCGSMHARVAALVKHLQAVHGKEDRYT